MFGLVFGILVLLAGIIAMIFFSIHVVEEEKYEGEGWNKKVVGTEKTKPLKKFALPVLFGALFLGLLITFFGCICNVPTGHTGVVTVFGKVKDETLDSGFHMKTPWESIVKMDNRVQKETTSLSCFSSDIQEVNVKYTLNFQINKQNASQIYKTIGKEYFTVTIAPAIAESVKVVVAKYTAEELVGAREVLAAAIEDVLIESLAKFNIEVVSTSIEDIDFTDSFTNAVEAKQVADQKAKQVKIEQEQAKMEAQYNKEIAEIQANAAAEVARIQAEADLTVQKINADAAEYTGKKEAAITLQALAGINGWSVVSTGEGVNQLYKPDGTIVNDAELKAGVESLIKYYYTQTWDGKLPETYMGEGDVSTVIIP